MATFTLRDFEEWSENQDLDRLNPGWNASSPNCRYTTDEGEHCVIGQFLADKGLLPDLDDSQNVEGFKALANELFPDLDEWTIEILSRVQADADCGVPWGEAVQENLA